ncbi:MAG: ABC transporter permease subunit [Bdellovibrionaceae bacterium]|nr:ABC transporter permease subunit [Pseudobdellovibrionaceae bacterium]
MVSLRLLLFAIVLLVLLSPYVILFLRFPTWTALPADRVLNVFAFTAWQAVVSALGAMLGGVAGAMGLLAFAHRSWLRLLALLPNAVPVVLVILATMNVWPDVRGLSGIVLIHVLLNVGLVSVSVAGLLATRLSGLADLAYIEGASRWTFLVRGALPQIAPDLFRLFLFVFAVCFSSFAVPLAIGGSQATTVEVLIYEQIRVSPDWSGAMGLAALQTSAIFLLAALIGRQTRTSVGEARTSPLLQWRPGVVFALLPVVIVVGGLFSRVVRGWAQFGALPGFSEELPRLAAGSVITGFLTGVICAVLLLLLMIARPQGWARRLLLGLAAPSSVLTGFALLFLWSETGWVSLVKIAFGLSLIFVPAFYRLRWDGALGALEGQTIVARTLGASERLIVSRVLLPQLWETCLFLAGLGSFWAWGDFALSAVVGEKTLTLAMLAQSLMGTYRLDLATAVVCMIFIGGTLSFSMFWGTGRVLGTQTQR